jgi:hypothetical protein
VGPFSVVLGKHTGTFDTSEYPFSHIEARADGKTMMVPGLHLATVGTIRDGIKWPNRDRRQGPAKRDAVVFDVLSPYTVGRMLKACAQLKQMQQNTEKSVEEITVGGAKVKRVLLHTAQKFYRAAVEMYLLEKVLDKAQHGFEGSVHNVGDVFVPERDAKYSPEWVDIGGQLMPRRRMLELEERIEAGRVSNLKAFAREIEQISRAYVADEWLWVSETCRDVFEVDLTKIGRAEFARLADDLVAVKTKFLNRTIVDAEKEFDALSRVGFGQDGGPADQEQDFTQVRGLLEENEFVEQMKDSIEKLKLQVVKLKDKLLSP